MNEVDTSQLSSFFGVIQLIVTVIPICGLIWQAALISAKVKQNTRDIDGIGTKLNASRTRHEQQYEELRVSLVSLNVQYGRMHVMLDNIENSIKEIKTQIVSKDFIMAKLKDKEQ
jgi:septal ring factor EnvC (AmiA/AmiB activator)